MHSLFASTPRIQQSSEFGTYVVWDIFSFSGDLCSFGQFPLNLRVSISLACFTASNSKRRVSTNGFRIPHGPRNEQLWRFTELYFNY